MAEPTGENLCVGTTDGNSLAEYTDWTEREITFVSPIELTSGTQYAIVVNAVDVVGDAELYWSTRVDNPYGDGDRYASSDSGSSWSLDENDDVWFKTKANGVEKDDGSFEPDAYNRADEVHGTTWVAQTFTAGSTYTISSVILKLAKMTTWGGTVETVTVSIRATGGIPEKPINPTPADNGTEVDFSDLTLSWEDGGNADTYDVWVGDLVNLYLVSEGQEDTSYVTNLTEVSSAYNDKIYWEIDAINDAGTTEGDVWNFDARPPKASDPNPASGYAAMTMDWQDFVWIGDPILTTYDVYFGITSGDLYLIVEELADVGILASGLLELLGAADYRTTYYWALDANNQFGVTAGDEWSFTTISYKPPLPTGITLNSDGVPTGTATGENNMVTLRKLVVAANSKIWVEDT